ncbi:hypothetical protein N7532_003645 [Penicillium argentinense]|uniref:Uncharacterized protein n=1 Tax=Penicillium argentinense TaxID=1131581 RepID=A0A9W9FMT1_9EURO|nr:uncharacterized protein N7532_003645 [Penicillium argentinense]KAJ5103116.1 hypothetical protein N7532_003645 [Penicillium argentinense]
MADPLRPDRPATSAAISSNGREFTDDNATDLSPITHHEDFFREWLESIENDSTLFEVHESLESQEGRQEEHSDSLPQVDQQESNEEYLDSRFDLEDSVSSQVSLHSHKDSDEEYFDSYASFDWLFSHDNSEDQYFDSLSQFDESSDGEKEELKGPTDPPYAFAEKMDGQSIFKNLHSKSNQQGKQASNRLREPNQLTKALEARINTDISQLLQRFENIMATATAENNTLTATAVESYQVDVESTALIRAAEDLLSVTRTMKEMWLFGKLDTIGEDERDVERREKLEADVDAVKKAVEDGSLEKLAPADLNK